MRLHLKDEATFVIALSGVLIFHTGIAKTFARYGPFHWLCANP